VRCTWSWTGPWKPGPRLELGIQVVTAAEAAEVTGQELIEAVRFTDGRVLEADLLVVCAGIRPEVDLKGVGLDLTVAGQALGGPDDEVIISSGPARYMYCRLVVRSGRLAGGLLLDRAADAPALIAAVRDHLPVAAQLDALRAGDLAALADRSPATGPPPPSAAG
jgi:NAD(P)H-nitrite reductase large subunit